MRKLADAGYIKREKILYGVAGIYSNTNKAKNIAELQSANQKIKVEQIKHDIAVLDTAIYFNKNGVPFEDMTTEKQLHMIDGFSVRKHRPDFIYTSDGKKICVEVELSLKAKDRLEKIIKDNFREYDVQVWVVPDLKSKISKILEKNKSMYTNIKILELDEVKANG